MGGNTSLPAITPTSTEFIVSGKTIKGIPDKLPPNKLKVVQLEHVGISEPILPKSMPHLTSLALTYNSIKEISPDMVKKLKGYPKLTTLDLSENKIESIATGFGGITQITALNLFANKLSTFNYTNKHIKTINVTHNNLHTLPCLDAKELQKLYFDWNYLTVLDFKMVSLTTLSLVCVGLEKIAPSFNFPNLELLDLKMNRLLELPNFEVTTPKLRLLDVSDNFLTEFPIVPVTIETLSIKSNNIKGIPHHLPLLENLKFFNFSNNQIDFVPMVPKVIRKLYGSSNKLLNFSASDTPFLSECCLDNNYLKIMPQIVKNQVIFYNMNHNKIEKIVLDYVSPKVVLIELVDNLIEVIPPEVFDLPCLEKLYLMHNQIREIPKEIINAKKLKKLNLSFNQIKEIPQLPENLKELHLAGNQIEVIPDYIANSGITLLDVNLNKIQKLPPLPNVTNLYVSQNELVEFPVLNDEIYSIDVSYNKLTTMPALSYPKLYDFDICHNQIVDVPKFSLPNLAYFKVAENPTNTVFDKELPALQQLDICHTKAIAQSSQNIREVLYTSDETKYARGKRLDFGNSSAVAEMRGVRETQEDSIIIQCKTVHGHSVYGVFDGHGGANTSLYCTLMVKKFVNDTDFVMTEPHVRTQTRKLQTLLEAKKYNDGSTMAFAIIEGNKVIIAHVGDARVLITDDKGNLRFSTPDHKPSSRSEFERIHASNGRVTNGRVNSILAVARSLGDLRIAESLSADPDIATYFLHDDEKWLFVGCDGVFDVLSNEYIAQLGAKIDDPDEFAYTIRNTAFGSNSMDNITSIAINLQKRRVDPDIM
ncbi:protein phosphatase 2C [Tritrichomonas foetus]|uniref:Protein phosphatase 2C n=1 Tax=Tritrichomonas foetus TaxID=1144522 RepID=A0A1J4KLL6_9EUKA|nr:protein phosphatase 2C [Tritrichomonas foetus]|eukprot:OHT12199.1 protein phosphatase 2C [Tritrichomonas foetus]